MTDPEATLKPSRLDGTINLPTLLALLGFMVAQGFLPGATGTGDADDADKAIEVHASGVHEGAVPQATYELEKAHDREAMARIERKLDALSVEVREMSQ